MIGTNLTAYMGRGPTYPKEGLDWLKVAHENTSGQRQVEEHYFSQLTKNTIREVYDKFKLDHMLFGFEPEYYIQMGKDD